MRDIMNRIWKNILQLETPPRTDESFFDLGGNSYMAGQICQDFFEETGMTVEIADFYEHETIDELIALIASRNEGKE